ncbi:biliverdin-producing heme oxygenase [Ideonella sp. A 288]|uniref:biliverdin-producing heme oxygenase n=1 Tax=Ideonella sp. A 288 TaxID=1962181 RepID=UPI000B4B4F6F|nr:biliverdin-producing heme oxygenase [Ideonella sp. A 288]
MPVDAQPRRPTTPALEPDRAAAAPAPGILSRLKQATAARHAALESRSVLLDPRLSHASYLACLRRFFGYYAPLERRLLRSHAWPGVGLAYGDRHKTPQLSQDLTALGVSPDDLAQTRLCHALPDLRSAARLFGCLYVIEGATLGGQIVTRHLQSSLGLTPQSGGAFFSGYGEHTGSRWKAFGAQLSAFALASGGGDEIVAAANETFETLDRWLYPAPPGTAPGHPAR